MISYGHFKKETQAAFASAGFIKGLKTLRFKGKQVSVIASAQLIRKGQASWNIGFWLHDLDGQHAPDRVELAHLNFRLERLFPADRELILEGGNLANDRQPECVQTFAQKILADYAPRLIQIAETSALKAEFVAGRLNSGLVRKEARSFLSSSVS